MRLTFDFHFERHFVDFGLELSAHELTDFPCTGSLV